jgi:hypothetical protein
MIQFDDNKGVEVYQIRVVNNLGQTVLQTDLKTDYLDIRNLPNGFYQLVIEHDSGISTSKFLKY